MTVICCASNVCVFLPISPLMSPVLPTAAKSARCHSERLCCRHRVVDGVHLRVEDDEIGVLRLGNRRHDPDRVKPWNAGHDEPGSSQTQEFPAAAANLRHHVLLPHRCAAVVRSQRENGGQPIRCGRGHRVRIALSDMVRAMNRTDIRKRTARRCRTRRCSWSVRVAGHAQRARPFDVQRSDDRRHPARHPEQAHHHRRGRRAVSETDQGLQRHVRQRAAGHPRAGDDHPARRTDQRAVDAQPAAGGARAVGLRRAQGAQPHRPRGQRRRHARCARNRGGPGPRSSRAPAGSSARCTAS